MIDYKDELYHYGIPGMRWGVRRWQNSDGTLTAAGRKRYGGTQKQFEKGIKKTLRSQERTRVKPAKTSDEWRARFDENIAIKDFHDSQIISRMNKNDYDNIVASKKRIKNSITELQKVLSKSKVTKEWPEILVDGMYEKMSNDLLELSNKDYKQYEALYQEHYDAYRASHDTIAEFVNKTYQDKKVKQYVQNRLNTRNADDFVNGRMLYTITSNGSDLVIKLLGPEDRTKR